MNADRLDSRAWLVWGFAAMLPMLVSRHPLVVLEMLVIVLAVRLTWASRLVRGWSWIARVAAVFVLTNTDWGHEQIRTRLVATLNKSGHGRFAIGRRSASRSPSRPASRVARTVERMPPPAAWSSS